MIRYENIKQVYKIAKIKEVFFVIISNFKLNLSCLLQS